MKIQKSFPSSEPKPKFKGWYSAYFLNSYGNANVDSFIPIFARYLGATASQVGLLSGLYTLVNLFQLLWANLFTIMKKNRIFIILGWFISPRNF
ncbi:MAG: hypothetical protein ACFFDT_35365 [Candidatus Hodarchaeota archaeon]